MQNVETKSPVASTTPAIPKTSNPIEACQICNHKPLKSILFIGYIPPVNTMPLIGSLPEEQPAYPLELLRCDNCTLVQIGLEVDGKVLFPPEYPYLSGSTRILRENFADLYRETNTLLNFTMDDLIIDIGSNDGTLLGNFKEGGHKVLGIEPSHASDIANAKGITTKMTYFDQSVARQVRSEFGPAKLVTAANVFAHIGNVHGVTKGIVDLLAPKGVFVSESHYLLDLVETLQYDTIYHEHLRHYSLSSLKWLFEKNGLEIFRVKRIPTHGGSIRVFSARKGERPVEGSVKELEATEMAAGLVDGKALSTFRQRVIQSKLDLLSMLAKIKKEGSKVYGIGAPSRGSTLVNYVGLDDGLIDCVMEIKGSHKIGKYIPGTLIPVLEESKLFEDAPAYALFFSWHIAKELAENLRKKGYKGKFIVPLPEPHIMS